MFGRMAGGVLLVMLASTQAFAQATVRDTVVITRPTVTSAEGTMGGALGASAGQMYFGLSGGLGMPMGDFGDAASGGLSIGGRMDYMLNPVFSVGANITWNGFGGDDDVSAGVTDASYSITQATGNVRYWFPAMVPWMTYLGAGLGFYGLHSEYTVSGIGDVSDTDWELGFNLHGGMLYPMGSNFALGGEAAFHNVMADEDAQYINVAAVARFGWAR